MRGVGFGGRVGFLCRERLRNQYAANVFFQSEVSHTSAGFPKTQLSSDGQVALPCHPWMPHRQRQFHNTMLQHEFFGGRPRPSHLSWYRVGPVPCCFRVPQNRKDSNIGITGARRDRLMGGWNFWFPNITTTTTTSTTTSATAFITTTVRHHRQWQLQASEKLATRAQWRQSISFERHPYPI